MVFAFTPTPPPLPLSVSRPKKTPQNEVKIFHGSFFKTGSKTTGRLKHFRDPSLLLVWPQQCIIRYLYLLMNCRSKLIWWNLNNIKSKTAKHDFDNLEHDILLHSKSKVSEPSAERSLCDTSGIKTYRVEETFYSIINSLE